MRYRAVIFDLGGTLIPGTASDEDLDYVRRMAEVLAVPAEDFGRLWQMTYEERTRGAFGSVQGGIKYICQQLRASVGEDRIELASRIPLDITKRMVMAPREGAIEVLSRLKSLGRGTGLVSNWSEHLPAVWQDCPLAPFLDVAVFSSSVGVMKPDPRIFLIACERLAVGPEACLYVADGMDQELWAATKLGMDAVMIRVSREDDHDPRREKWDGPVISSLNEVLTLARAGNSQTGRG